VGILIEEKMAIGTLVVRIILDKNDNVLRNGLAAAGFGVTSVDAEGVRGRVKLILYDYKTQRSRKSHKGY